jgi:hypothetical protein
MTEFVRRFAEYPAEYLYELLWRSAASARLMGETLSQALDVRSRANRWLAIVANQSDANGILKQNGDILTDTLPSDQNVATPRWNGREFIGRRSFGPFRSISSGATHGGRAKAEASQ